MSKLLLYPHAPPQHRRTPRVCIDCGYFAPPRCEATSWTPMISMRWRSGASRVHAREPESGGDRERIALDLTKLINFAAACQACASISNICRWRTHRRAFHGGWGGVPATPFSAHNILKPLALARARLQCTRTHAPCQNWIFPGVLRRGNASASRDKSQHINYMHLSTHAPAQTRRSQAKTHTHTHITNFLFSVNFN